MLSRIMNAMAARGFLRAPSDAADMGISLKVTSEGICYVCFLDDTNQKVNKREIFTREMLAKVGQDNLPLYSKYTQECYGILVVITDDPSASRAKIGEKTPFWIVDAEKNRLMIYEDQPNEFLDARMAIEGQLQTSPVKDTLKQLKILLSPVNISLIALNFLVFFVLSLLGSTTDASFMAKHGALCSKTFLENKEYWTLLTSMFLHFGFMHLFYNMVTLLYVGKPVEVMLGKWKYLALYLLSGIGSGYISYLWEIKTVMDTNIVNAGASGAICGVCGAMAYLLFRNRKRYQKVPYLRYLIFFGIIIMNGMGDSTINNCAHISGLAIGLFLAVLFYRKPHTTGNRI